MRNRRQDRREERREDRKLGTRRSNATRYQMRQKMVSIGQDFWIENDQGQKVFKEDTDGVGKEVDLCDPFFFKSMQPVVGHLTSGPSGQFAFDIKRDACHLFQALFHKTKEISKHCLWIRLERLDPQLSFAQRIFSSCPGDCFQFPQKKGVSPTIFG